MLIPLILESFSLQLFIVRIHFLKLTSKSSVFIELICLFFLHLYKLCFYLRESFLIMAELSVKGALVTLKSIDGSSTKLNVPLQIGTSTLIHIQFFTHSNELLCFTLVITFEISNCILKLIRLTIHDFNLVHKSFVVALECTLVLFLALEFLAELSVLNFNLVESLFGLCYDLF